MESNGEHTTNPICCTRNFFLRYLSFNRHMVAFCSWVYISLRGTFMGDKQVFSGDFLGVGMSAREGSFSLFLIIFIFKISVQEKQKYQCSQSNLRCTHTHTHTSHTVAHDIRQARQPLKSCVLHMMRRASTMIQSHGWEVSQARWTGTLPSAN